MHGDILVALVTFLLVLVTAASIYASWKISKSQEALQERLLRETHDRHNEQRRFEQRTQLIPLWEYMSGLREIDPEAEVIVPQVVKVVNTLELIALCKEADIIDKTVVLRTFREKYISLYETIKRVGVLEGYSRRVTGEDLLNENHAAVQLYNDLINERRNMDKPMPLIKEQ